MRRLQRRLLASLAAAWLAACSSATPTLDRRTAYLAENPSLPRDRAEAISAGVVQIGMTMEEVRAALGPPLHVRRSMRAGPAGPVAGEVWIYPGPVARPSAVKAAANSEFLIRYEFVAGILANEREI